MTRPVPTKERARLDERTFEAEAEFKLCSQDQFHSDESSMAKRLILVLFVLLSCLNSACSKRPGSFADSLREKYANEAFAISVLKPLPDGRPVIGIEWVAAHEYAKEPLRGYRLLVRKNGEPYYMRTFGSDEFRPGFALDLAMSKVEFKPDDKLSVRLEVNLDEYFKESIFLSNSLAIDIPPDTAADFALPPR